MLVLLAGIVIWVAAHFFKRLMPVQRAALNTKFGDNAARGIVSGVILLSVILMVVGYRSADASSLFYVPAEAGKHVAMLLAMVGFILMGVSHSTSRLRTLIRHPMLLGFTLWAIAHLLVRGDNVAVTLFGALAAWSIASIFLINAKEGAWVKPTPAKPLNFAGDIKVVVIGVVISIILIAIHIFVFGLFAKA